MEKLINDIIAQCDAIKEDINKGTKASAARVRKATLCLEKLGKEYRKASIEAAK